MPRLTEVGTIPSKAVPRRAYAHGRIPRPLLAIVDESIRDPGPKTVGAYVLGCVVLPHSEEVVLRDRVTARGPFHWHSATHGSKLAMLRQIGAWNLLVSGYVYRGLYPIGREGARQECVRGMLLDLREWGVSELVMESRRPIENVKDEVTIIHACKNGRGPAGLEAATHWRNKSETLLRLADAIAGAVRAATGRPARFSKDLAAIPTFIRDLT